MSNNVSANFRFKIKKQNRCFYNVVFLYYKYHNLCNKYTGFYIYLFFKNKCFLVCSLFQRFFLKYSIFFHLLSETTKKPRKTVKFTEN